jgi:hypothetical protein
MLSDSEVNVLLDWIDGMTDEQIGVKYAHSTSENYFTKASAGHRLKWSILQKLGISRDMFPDKQSIKNYVLDYIQSPSYSVIDALQQSTTFSHVGLQQEMNPGSAVRAGEVFARGSSASTQDKSQSDESSAGGSGGIDYKALVISDTHFPFACESAIYRAIRDHADANEMILLGDVFDMHAASRFSKEHQISIETEVFRVKRFLEYATSVFPRVVILQGNHDTRPMRWINTANPSVGMLMLSPIDYIRYMWMNEGNTETISKICLPRYDVAWSHQDYPIKLDHVYCVGDALLGHFEKTNKGPATTVYRLTMEWLPQWIDALPTRSVGCIMQGHVHRLSKSMFGRITMIETGCMCYIMDYAIKSPNYSLPGLGYAVLYQKDGKTDHNRTNYVYLDYNEHKGGYVPWD